MKRILVTGSSDGIGKATAIALARRGAEVIVHGRSRQRAENARRQVGEASSNGRVAAVTGNFASLKQVHAMAGHILSRFDRLDVLVNNAGIVASTRRESEDGYELTLAVNHLAPFLLTNLLLDLLVRSAPARIINVSSMVHSGAEIDFADLHMERRYDGYRAYSNSKLANLLFTYALARRLEGTGVTVNALHPGVINTKLLHTLFSGGSPAEQGASTPVYLALSAEVEGVSGKYFSDRRVSSTSASTHDVELQEKLWQASAELTGLPAEPEQ